MLWMKIGLVVQTDASPPLIIALQGGSAYFDASIGYSLVKVCAFCASGFVYAKLLDDS